VLGFLLLCKNDDGFHPVVEVLNVSVVFVEGDLVSCSGGRNAFHLLQYVVVYRLLDYLPASWPMGCAFQVDFE
jgi:hypothetical protein